MTKVVKLRRGTNAQSASFTGAEGEVTVNIDKDCLVVHDGSTVGGFEHVNLNSNQRLTNKDIVANSLNVIGVATATNGFVGNITGNVTGNVTGIVTGNITGNLTGNVNSTGVSTFKNTVVGGATTELVVDGDVSIVGSIGISSDVSISGDVNISNSLVASTVETFDVNTNTLEATDASVSTLDVGGGINPGSNLYVEGTSVVSDSISIGSSAPSPEDTRFFAANFSDEEVFTTPGTYTWTAPVGVTSVSVVCVGGGGGGVRVPYSSSRTSGAGGGGLAWKNNILVTPGQSYTVVVGSGGTVLTTPSNFTVHYAGTGGTSYFISEGVVAAYGGAGGISFDTSGTGPALGGTYFGDGGGNGGAGGRTLSSFGSAGSGGAGGYTGVGGTGASTTGSAPFNGAGGGGGGGHRSLLVSGSHAGGAGGGVGLYGQGLSGIGGTFSDSSLGNPGQGGSGGSTGTKTLSTAGVAGVYGGGGRSSALSYLAYEGGSGAVRIVWSTGGTVKAFPSTNVATGTDYFVYNRNGNVGIGTTNPSSKLDIIGGDIKVGVNTSHGIILTSSNGTKYRLIVNNNGTLTTTYVP